MTKALNDYLALKIAQRKEKDSFRSFKINEGAVDFCSNDYLGLAKDYNLREQTHQDLQSFQGSPNGSTGARTITGTSAEIVDLEQYLAEFHRAEAGLIFNSGYSANLGLFSALPYRGDTVIYDQLIHASIRDGLNMSRANSYSFKHNDLKDLEKKLQSAKGIKYVAVESIYSMDGDDSPLEEIVKLCEKYNAALIVDEAHSNGLFGKNGRGLVASLNLEDRIFARLMTFGKALGNHGAVVLGSKNLKDFLINYARPFIYTTAPSPHQVFSVKNAYDKMAKLDDKRLLLSELIKYFKLKVQESEDLVLIESFSPIQCVIIPGNSRVKAVCGAVQNDGFDIRPIVAPTVPEGKERIRICLHSYNNFEQVDRLVASLAKQINEHG